MVEINETQLVNRFIENDLPYETLPIGDGIFVLITQYGGRVLGPFLEKGGPSLLWINPVLLDADKFREFVRSNQWNIGGERNWIAPEIQYITGDRANPNGSVRIQPQMDPGQYLLEKHSQSGLKLSQELTLEAKNTAVGFKELHLEAHITPVENPLRMLSIFPEVMKGVRYAGYEQSVCLSEKHSDSIMSELWNMVQLNPGGEILVAASPSYEMTNYSTQPIYASYYSYQNHLLHFKITGDCMYKIGLRSPNFANRVGYLNFSAPDNSYLIVRNFLNNPSSFYIEEPAWTPNSWGDSLHIYNDGGRWGGFGELEVHGQTIGGLAGKSSSLDAMQLWFFWGTPDQLTKIAGELLLIAP